MASLCGFCASALPLTAFSSLPSASLQTSLTVACCYPAPPSSEGRDKIDADVPLTYPAKLLPKCSYRLTFALIWSPEAPERVSSFLPLDKAAEGTNEPDDGGEFKVQGKLDWLAPYGGEASDLPEVRRKVASPQDCLWLLTNTSHLCHSHHLHPEHLSVTTLNTGRGMKRTCL